MLNEYEIIQNIVKELSYLPKKDTSKKKEDGRNESTDLEKEIIVDIENITKKLNLKVFIGKPRHWFDIAILIEDNFIPINIKCSTLKSADNIGSLVILLYALTNYKMKYNQSYNSSLVVDIIKDKISDNNNRDYWFIIYDKNNQEYIFNSLKGCSELKENEYNLPFQINWKKNKVYNVKPSSEVWNSIKLLYTKYKITWQKKFLAICRNQNISNYVQTNKNSKNNKKKIER